jgi:hypothetical protein
VSRALAAARNLNSRVMKALVAGLVVIAVIGAAFGIYRWQSGDDERDGAEAATEEFAAYFSRTAGASCESSQLEQLPDGSWRFHLDCGQGSRCLAVDLERYHLTRKNSIYVGGDVEGVTDVRCSPDPGRRRKQRNDCRRASGPGSGRLASSPAPARARGGMPHTTTASAAGTARRAATATS